MKMLEWFGFYTSLFVVEEDSGGSPTILHQEMLKKTEITITNFPTLTTKFQGNTKWQRVFNFTIAKGVLL